MTTTHTETIVDENDIELTVKYKAERSLQVEECHGQQFVENGISITLIHVEIVIAGTGIDLVDMLNKSQQEAIVNQLSF